MAIYNSSKKKFKVDVNGNIIPSTSIYEPTFQLPKSETDLMLQDLDLAKLENQGFDPKTVMTGKTLDQRIGKEAVARAVEGSKTIKEIPQPVDNKGLSTISAANIATGISTLANVASSIYGATQASKMKPRLASYQAPIEAVLVNDNSSAIKTAGEENIDKSINTARSVYQKNGLVGMDGILLSKENDSLNQLSGQLAQYRTSIDSQNAQIENTVNAQNKQNAMQVDQFNVQTENQFEQYKSGLIGMGMKNATDAIQSGTESIFGNIMAGKQMNLSSITSEMSSILQQMEGKDPALIDPKLRSRLEQLKMQKSELEQSTFKV